MRPEELKKSVTQITIPPAVRHRVVEACNRPSASRFRFKPARVAVASLLVLVMLVGIPYFFLNTASGTELVLGRSPLAFTAAAMSGDDKYILEEFTVWQEIDLGRYVPVMNFVPGFPFHFSAPGADIEIAVDAGELIYWDTEIRVDDDDYLFISKGSRSGDISRGKTYSCRDEDWIFWSPLCEEGLVESAVIEYRVIDNENIIGYGLIQISAQGNGRYSAQLLRSLGFPKVGGKYQKVTAENLQELRAEALEEGSK